MFKGLMVDFVRNRSKIIQHLTIDFTSGTKFVLASKNQGPIVSDHIFIS